MTRILLEVLNPIMGNMHRGLEEYPHRHRGHLEGITSGNKQLEVYFKVAYL
jgi:hypothetical protein